MFSQSFDFTSILCTAFTCRSSKRLTTWLYFFALLGSARKMLVKLTPSDGGPKLRSLILNLKDEPLPCLLYTIDLLLHKASAYKCRKNWLPTKQVDNKNFIVFNHLDRMQHCTQYSVLIQFKLLAQNESQRNRLIFWMWL